MQTRKRAQNTPAKALTPKVLMSVIVGVILVLALFAYFDALLPGLFFLGFAGVFIVFEVFLRKSIRKLTRGKR